MAEQTKRFYPAFLDLEGRSVVVIGPGRRAERKARQLAGYGASVVLITPEPSISILQSQVEGLLDVESRAYVRGDLEGATLVFCDDTDAETRGAVAAEARGVGCLTNITGDASLTSFLAPSIIHREPLQIAVSTGGVVPQLAKHLRRTLAEQFGEEWAAYSRLLAEVRGVAIERLTSTAAIDDVLEAVIVSDLLERVRLGDAPSATRVFEEFAPAEEGVIS